MFWALGIFLLGVFSAQCDVSGYFLRTDTQKQSIVVSQYTQSLLQGILEPQLLTLKTESGLSFEAYFFDRKSPRVLILGQGFPGDKLSMVHLARFFSDYDIITFDYRWNTLLPLLLNGSTWLCPLDTFIYQEEEEICAVARFLEQRKNYEQKVCLGHCYSNFHFVQAQVNAQKVGKRLFDKLILDSCWLSLYALAESISLDPWLPFNPQDGGAPALIKSILAFALVRQPLLMLLKLLVPRVSIEEYLPYLTDTPILFIYGQDDRMVLPSHFEKLWKATKTSKAAFITPHKHSDTAYSCPFYYYICDQFIQAPTMETFVQKVTGLG